METEYCELCGGDGVMEVLDEGAGEWVHEFCDRCPAGEIARQNREDAMFEAADANAW